jgi:hypothetical protein
VTITVATGISLGILASSARPRQVILVDLDGEKTR